MTTVSTVSVSTTATSSATAATAAAPASALYPPAPDTPWARVAGRVARGVAHRAAARSGITLGERPGKDADLVLHRPGDFYRRLGVSGLVGFGESYVAGDWDATDLAGALTALCRRITTLVPAWLQRLGGLYTSRRPASQENTVTGARRNISAHYDLSNDFFATFLDPGLSYSSALFDLPEGPGRDATLAEGQDAKIDRALDRAGIGEGSRVLEIGTGWGELSLHAARRGARVTSVTLSTEQAELARGRIAEAGLSDRVEVELCDYREVTGSYDAVVSVEMVEAVGAEYWDGYMQVVHDRLVPGGRAVIQAITMDHAQMLATKDAATWITTYVFPGGVIPSVRALNESASRAGLRPGMRRSFGRDYAETLHRWDGNFRAAAATGKADALGFGPEFRRLWHFYLAYCEAGFAADYIDVGQLEYVR